MTDNEEIAELLNEWFSEPDGMGVEFWLEYEYQLEQNPFIIQGQ